MFAKGIRAKKRGAFLNQGLGVPFQGIVELHSAVPFKGLGLRTCLKDYGT